MLDSKHSLKTLSDSANYLAKYLSPSYKNLERTIAAFTGVILLPISWVAVVYYVLISDKNEINNSVLGVPLLMLLGGLNEAISAMLTVSIIQGIRYNNITKLLDESKFLAHGNMQEIKTMQYVTVGTGVKDFTRNAVPLFISLPTYISTSIINLVYIDKSSKSHITPLTVFGASSAVAFLVYLLSKGVASYSTYNQNLENELVKKVTLIEKNSSAISIIGASKAEHICLQDDLQKITNTV